MPFWNDVSIRKAIIERVITVDSETHKPEYVGPASLDLTLGSEALIPIQAVFAEEPTKEQLEASYERVDLRHKRMLRPGDIVIASAAESLELSSDVIVNVHTRSSYARMGISAELSSFANPGYSGNLPIVIKNHGVFTLPIYKGLRLCQAVFLSGELASVSYAEYGRYAGERGASVPDPRGEKELQDYRRILLDKYGGVSEYLNERAAQSYQKIVNELSDGERKRLGLD